MKRWLRPPLAASLAGHAVALFLLIAFAGQIKPLLPPVAERRLAVTVMLSPPLAPEPAATVAEPPPPGPPPPVVEAPPPEPPPPVVEAPPPPPVPAQPPPKVVARPPPRRATRPSREQSAPANPAPAQTAALPPATAPAPAAPVVSAGYRAMLGGWLESHKRYPEAARGRGEEGRAVLRFRVERSGRLLDYAIVQSTGYADLDAALDQMMRGASLPPFPPEMTASDIDVSVAIRFALAR